MAGLAVPKVGIEMATTGARSWEEEAGREVAKFGTEAVEGSDAPECTLGEGEGERDKDLKRSRQEVLGVPKPGLGLRDQKGILFFSRT